MRRYDIDWLRVIALGLLIVYHTAIVFQSWGGEIRFPQSEEAWHGLWLVMSIINTWRIPLLFFVAGMGAWFSIQRRGAGGMLKERSLRILLPLVFCSFTIVPLYYFLYQKWTGQEVEYVARPFHLWFLVNIFIYTLLLSPLMFHFKRHADSRILIGLRKLLKHPVGLFVLYIPFIVEAVWTSPFSFSLFVATPHGFWYGALAFLFGFTLVAVGDLFWNAVIRLRFILIGIGLLGYAVRFVYFQLEGPPAMMMAESLSWIFGLCGWAARHLNRPSPTLGYLTQATYPVYIFHMLAMLWSAQLVLQTELPTALQFVLVTLGTYAIGFLLYEVVRRLPVIRTLFGMPWRAKRPPPPLPKGTA